MKAFLTLSFCLCLFAATAQHQISGTVKDGADGSPFQYATVALLRSDSSLVTGAMSGNGGKFVLENVAAGNYLLQTSFIGYEKTYRSVNVPSQSDMGEIVLSESSNRLKEVVATASRPLIVSRADRYVVNVSGNIQSAGRNMLDIMRNTPGVLTDAMGNITVMGNSVQVWIDGRPSRMSGEELRTFLTSMQGGEIDRLEVITNPSSRYEAEGSGGIIDIRTKKGLQFGLNGTFTAGYQQGQQDRENAGVDLNWRREKVNAFGNFSFVRSNNWERVHQTNVMQTSDGEISFDQNTLAKQNKAGLRSSVRAGLDYFLNAKNTLGIIVNAYHLDGGSADIKGNSRISPAYNGINYSTSDNIQSGNRDGVQVNANYQALLFKPGQQFNLDLDYAHFSFEPFQQTANRYYKPDGTLAGATEQLRNTNPQTIDVYSGKTDYSQPLWKDARMEAGAKYSQSRTDNDLRYEMFGENAWQTDVNRTNRFVYTEQTGAAYISISQRAGKFSLQAGLRGEYTHVKGEQKTTGAVNDSSYFNLFPTFMVNYQASKLHTFGLSYSRRLSRPAYTLLNPFEKIIDAYSFTAGNPYLSPSYTHNLQLTHMFAKGLMTRIGYSNTADLFMLTPIEDAAGQRYGTTYLNFGRSQNLSIMMNYRRQIVKRLTANLTVQGAYLVNTSAEGSGEFVNKGGSLIVQLNNNLSITPTLSAEVTGMYVSGMRQGYFVIQEQGNFSIGLRQMLLKNKLSLSLNVNDILYTAKEKGYARYGNVNYSLLSEHDSRYASLTLRYNFGSSTVKAARNKASGIEDEAGRAR